MFKYFKAAMAEAKKQKEMDKQKARLLSKDMDYAFLEHIIQKMNENPLLQVKITLKDGTVLDCNTRPKKKTNIDYIEPVEDFMEVRQMTIQNNDVQSIKTVLIAMQKEIDKLKKTIEELKKEIKKQYDFYR